MTDYIPNDPDCPKCKGSGSTIRKRPWFGWKNCHCQHPGVLIELSMSELRGLARREALGGITDDAAREIAADICTRHGPTVVRLLDDYYNMLRVRWNLPVDEDR